MTDKILPGLALVLTSLLAVSAAAQDDTAAASGMTSGLPGVSAARQAELMYVRAQAQKSRPEAERAAMARTAEQALDEKITTRTLEEARETKELKKKASYDFQLKKAEDAYKGVSQSEINAWDDGAGSVKVQRGVPSQFLASLPPEEEPEEQGGHFGFLKAPGKAAKGAAAVTVGGMKKALSWRPFGKNKDEEAPEPEPAAPSQIQPTVTAHTLTQEVQEEKNDGFLTKIPFVGGKKKKQEPVAYEEPAAVETALTAAPEAIEEKEGLFSKIPFVGHKKDKEAKAEADLAALHETAAGGMTAADAFMADAAAHENAEKDGFLSKMKIPFIGHKKDPADGVEVAPEIAAATTVGTGSAAAAEEEKKGFVGRMFGGKKDKSDDAPVLASGGANLFGKADDNDTIDASLFPDSGAPDEDLRAQDLDSQKRKLLKMPDLSGVKVPKIKVPSPLPEEPKPSLPKVDRSGVHSGGTRTYIVQTPNAQFMRFGESALNSETMTLNSGQAVEMTKAGDEWSSVKLSNGTTGIMRNKDLRPANPGEGATASPAPGPAPDFATAIP